VTKRLLALFCKDWDLVACQRLEASGRYRFHHEGFDLFSFPSNARLMTFDILRFVERMAKKYGGRIDGVVSHDEQFGALAAALIAERLGLPGPGSRAILTAQHKLACRQLQEQVVPEACPRYTSFPYTLAPDDPIDLPFPFFVKPIKAAFSVLARKVRNRDELTRHLRFRPWERHIIKRLIRPFNDVAMRAGGFDCDSSGFIAEEAMQGEQLNLDGYVFGGEVRILGVIDEVMYPGTSAFLRFQYPSRLPPALQEKARETATRLIRALNFRDGFFNIELFVDPATGKIGIIEVNPRLASQLGDLYERVDGVNPFAMACELALGRDPRHLPCAHTPWGAAASFVYRKFDGSSLEQAPPAATVAALQAAFPDAVLHAYPKRGGQLEREMKWLGSHRYGVLNLGGLDEPDLRRRFEAASARLDWPALYDANAALVHRLEATAPAAAVGILAGDARSVIGQPSEV
jgi:hypothetical protein